jgi:F-type H+-transporting ATPase subunit a
MVITTVMAIILMSLATKKRSLIPSRIQMIGELVYNFIHDMIKSSIGNEEGEKFFPLIFSFFCFILISNVLGLTPYSFTSTSHLAVTFSLALVAFLAVTIFAIIRNGFKGFIHMFLPSGVPILMAPVIFLIELFSFLVRPITLSVRLFANMVAGHVLLKVVAGFIISLGIIFGAFSASVAGDKGYSRASWAAAGFFPRIKKGVYRFKSHEEADQWLMDHSIPKPAN